MRRCASPCSTCCAASTPNEGGARGYAGRIGSGVIVPGQQRPGAARAARSPRCCRSGTYDGPLTEAQPGQSVVVRLDRELDISRGDWLVEDDAAAQPFQTRQFAADLAWLDAAPLALAAQALAAPRHALGAGARQADRRRARSGVGRVAGRLPSRRRSARTTSRGSSSRRSSRSRSTRTTGSRPAARSSWPTRHQPHGRRRHGARGRRGGCGLIPPAQSARLRRGAALACRSRPVTCHPERSEGSHSFSPLRDPSPRYACSG